MMRIVVLLFLLTSCTKPTLSVQSEYWTREDLASMYVDTPDPRKSADLFGQRLNISWSIPKKDFQENLCQLKIQVRLKNGELKKQDLPLDASNGRFCYQIIGEDYTKKGGLLSYFIVLEVNGKAIAESKHKFWVEEVKVS